MPEVEVLERRDCPQASVSLVGTALVLAPHDGRTVVVLGLVPDPTGQTDGMLVASTLGPRGRNLAAIPADAISAIVVELHAGQAVVNLSGMPDVVFAC